jgi:hypothetical protein
VVRLPSFSHGRKRIALVSMTSTPVPFTRSTLPKTLRDWRISGWEPKGSTPRDVWTPLEQLFLERGLTLWKKRYTSRHVYLLPGNGLPRAPDGFVYSTQVSDTMPEPGFDLTV